MPQNPADDSLRKHVLYLLRGGGAHLSFDDFAASFPPDLCNRQIEGLPYTPWQVLEHMRLAQWDILEFSRDPNHVSPEFPKGYWPRPDELGQAKVEALRAALRGRLVNGVVVRETWGNGFIGHFASDGAMMRAPGLACRT